MSYKERLGAFAGRVDGDLAWAVVGEALDEILAALPTKKSKAPYMTRPVESTDVRMVFEHWVNVMLKNPKTTKLTAERRRVIQARLKDGYAVGEILRAINGCALSDFHMARAQYRGATKYNDLTLILRNGSKLEGFRDTLDGRAGNGSFL